MIVEDREEIRSQLKWGLKDEYEVLSAGRRQEALSLFKTHRPGVITLDLGLPPCEDGAEEGFRCLEEILEIAPHTRVIVITGSNERDHAFKAVMSGACDYYRKPIDLNELKVILRRAFNLAGIERDGGLTGTSGSTRGDSLGDLLGHSRRMQEVFATIRKVAASDVTVLITGESGTGKELAARAVHRLSSRRGGPFVGINCGAIPENLIESELFGHEKGSFSGAHARVQGNVEFASRGILFLDEIGELPPVLQVKLLRFLQEKTIQRVGGREEIPVDARIIAATNRDIAAEAAHGTFREDLYYRLSVIHIQLPPLRDREGDILLLAENFLKRACTEFKKRGLHFSAAAVRAIEGHHWPGNVRELENMVKRAVIMSDTTLLDPEDLGFVRGSSCCGAPGTPSSLRDARERAERDTIASVIESQRHNMAKAARLLGVSRPTLYDLARKHGICRPDSAGTA